MADQPKRKKKVVRAEKAAGNSPASDGGGAVWTPAPEAKGKATRLRLFAWILWLLAIGVQLFAIFWVLKQVPVNTLLLVGAIVATGAFSITGSLLWKKSNRLDPASKQDKVRFFVQNQLGAIMAIVTFLPLIILIFMNRDMDGRQKAIAGGIGIAVLLVAAAFGVSYESPSQEQYAEEAAIVTGLTGQDYVYWTRSGKVFHLCEDVPDVNRESRDGTIYEGSVADAHADSKDRLTKRWESEARICGYSDEQIENARESLAAASSDTD